MRVSDIPIELHYLILSVLKISLTRSKCPKGFFAVTIYRGDNQQKERCHRKELSNPTSEGAKRPSEKHEGAVQGWQALAGLEGGALHLSERVGL